MIKDTFISNDMNKVYFSYNWQFLLFSITHGVRSFCADRKNQRALRMDAFLTASEADVIWVMRNSLGYPHFMCVTTRSDSPHTHPKTIDAVCLKA